MRKVYYVEHYGLEKIMQDIIKVNEDAQGIPAEKQTDVRTITRRTEEGLDIINSVDGSCSVYMIGDFAVTALIIIDCWCLLVGHDTNGKDPNECLDCKDSLVDISSLLNENYITLDGLTDSIRNR